MFLKLSYELKAKWSQFENIGCVLHVQKDFVGHTDKIVQYLSNAYMNYTEAITSIKTSNAIQYDAIAVLKTEMLHIIITDNFADYSQCNKILLNLASLTLKSLLLKTLIQQLLMILLSCTCQICQLAPFGSIIIWHCWRWLNVFLKTNPNKNRSLLFFMLDCFMTFVGKCLIFGP